MEEKIVVSISLLTAGKKEELEKCFQSLQPLRNAVPTEVIVVDTGCNAEKRKLIEKYATKIVDFVWCNNFAKARNAGLEKAVGEWFFYLDDDEWFEDLSEIIAFFQTGEYKKYRYGIYQVRNYEDFEGKTYKDIPVGRMIQRTSQTRFIYSIHECFARTDNPTKYFHTFVHHYGYVYKSEEERLAHARRNIQPLLEECEKEPDNLRHKLQLMQEYQALGEAEKAEEIGSKVIAQYDSDDNQQIYYFNSLLVLTLKAYSKQKKFKELILAGEKLKNHPYIGKLAEAYVYALLAYGYFEEKEYTETRRSVKSYLAFWKDYQKDDSMYTPFSTGILSPCFEKGVIRENLHWGIWSAIELQDFKTAVQWMKLFGWTEKHLMIRKELLDKILTTLCCEEKQEADAVEMCNMMLQNSVAAEYTAKRLSMMLEELPEQEKQKLKKRVRLLQPQEWCWKEWKALCQAESGTTVEKIWNLLEQYRNAEIEWNRQFDFVWEDNEPEEIYGAKLPMQTVKTIDKLLEEQQNGSAQKRVEYFKQLLTLQPQWKEAVKICLKAESEKMQKQQETPDAQKTELYRLAEQVKAQAKERMLQGKKEEAAGILRQVLAILPEDAESRELLAVCLEE